MPRVRKIIRSILTTWTIFAYLYVHFYSVCSFRMFFSQRRVEEVTLWRSNVFYNSMTSCLLLLFTLYYLLWKRKTVSHFFKDLSNALLGVRAEAQIFFRLKLFIGTSLAYSAVVAIIGLTGTFYDYMRLDYLGLELYSLGINIQHKQRWMEITVTAVDYFLYSIAPLGYGLLVSLLFTLIPRSLYLIAKDVKNSLESRTVVNLTELAAWKKKFYATSILVDRCNDIFEFYLFVWYAVTLIVSCYNTSNFIFQVYDSYSLRIMYMICVNFQDLFNLTFLTLEASKVSEMTEKILRRVSSVTDEATKAGNGPEVVSLYQEVLVGTLGVKIGGCFVITKKLLLSFFGLGVTYAVVAIQLVQSKA